ncbi:MAG: FAD-binding protein [Nitrososphaerota archaeon]
MAQHQTIESDVLVIGGGASAMMAALEARKVVKDVVMVSKALVGRSGCTAVAIGGFAAAFGSTDTLDDPDLHFKDTLEGGYFLNERRLVNIMVSEACKRVAELEELGFKFRKREERFLQNRAVGHSVPRICSAASGRKIGADLGRCLASAVEGAGLKIFEKVMIVDLITEEGSVTGALGLDLKSGDFILFKAKATVLGTGGSGRLYLHTTNPSDVTGDGYGMALRAGATLIDMEFVQFYPCTSLWPVSGYLILDKVFADGAYLLNAKGERFMIKHGKEAEMVTRDILARAIFLEVLEGRGIRGGVHLSYSGIPEHILKTVYREEFQLFLARGVDLRSQPIVVAPAAHFVMGGILINEDGEASLPNLYAAGEVTGGLHGANRIPGNALTEALVFGARAGRAAAERALRSKFSDVDSGQVGQIVRFCIDLKKGNGIKPQALLKELQRTMWEEAGIVRSADGLKRAIGKIQDLREKFSKISASSLLELKTAIELRNLLDVGQMVAESALMREESRGAHFRIDYPSRDDGWLCHIAFQKRGDTVHKLKIPVR